MLDINTIIMSNANFLKQIYASRLNFVVYLFVDKLFFHKVSRMMSHNYDCRRSSSIKMRKIQFLVIIACVLINIFDLY